MPSSYETLHLFRSSHGHLLEIRRLDLPHDSAGHRIRQWLWVTDRTVSTLKFIGRVDSPKHTLSFRECRLSFDANGGELVWCDGDAVFLTPEPYREPDALRKRLIHNHLN